MSRRLEWVQLGMKERMRSVHVGGRVLLSCRMDWPCWHMSLSTSDGVQSHQPDVPAREGCGYIQIPLFSIKTIKYAGRTTGDDTFADNRTYRSIRAITIPGSGCHPANTVSSAGLTSHRVIHIHIFLGFQADTALRDIRPGLHLTSFTFCRASLLSRAVLLSLPGSIRTIMR